MSEADETMWAATSLCVSCEVRNFAVGYEGRYAVRNKCNVGLSMSYFSRIRN